MQDQSIHTFEFANGLTLLVEEMKHVQSASFAIMTPAGSVYEPAGANGTAAALCDMMTRGAGARNSRELSDALDYLGVQRNENVGWNFLTFSGATLADNLLKALPIYAEILQSPLLPEDQFSAVMSGVEQSLLSEEDDPQRKVLVELRKRSYDQPWNRPTEGTLTDLSNIHYQSTLQFYQQNVRPNGSLIGVAGNVSANEIRDEIERLFGSWKTSPETTLTKVPSEKIPSHYLHHDSSQTHIGLAYDAVPYGHPDYYAAWAAVSILSGGSSSRLFTEVREKRGLCYSVYAALNTLLTEGRVLGYAGTTTERAQETLDVMLHEIHRLKAGIDQDELTRCRARAKSSLIMQQESTGARASSMARDWFHLGKVVTLSEVHAAVEALTVDKVLGYVERSGVKDLTVLSVGREPLNVPVS